MSTLNSKRFVIRKSLIGKNQIISFTNKKGIQITYNHDIVYEVMKDKLNNMNCFTKYKSYTSSNNIPVMLRNMELVQYYMTQCHDKAVSHSTISGLSENEVMVYVSSILTTSTNN